MKKILCIFVLLFSISFIALPANANNLEKENNYSSGNVLANQTRTRYVYVRGKRYRVTYRLYRRNGRLYYRIVNYRRA